MGNFQVLDSSGKLKVVSATNGTPTNASWTPVWTSSGGGTPTYTAQTGFVTKTDREVTAHGRLTISNKGTLAAGTLTITGIPYTAVGGVVTVGRFSGLSQSMVYFGGYVSGSSVVLQVGTAAITAGGALNVSDISNSMDIEFTAHFYTT